MTASTVDTAQLPRTGSAAPGSPAEGPTERRPLRGERRQIRRRQQRCAALGISVLAAVFVLCVLVLGGIR